MDVAAWLRKLELEQYEPAFRENEINERVLPIGGAAHRPLREDSAAGMRAGERKTGWTKPLPRRQGYGR